MQERRGLERRRFPRGGRREGDQEGYAPLIYLVAPADEDRERVAASLLNLKFAVATFGSADEALTVARGLCPNAMIVSLDELKRVAEQVPVDREQRPIPIVPLEADVHGLVQSLRTAFRTLV